MDNRKKLIIISLIVLTLVLGAASIFVSQQLQQIPVTSTNTIKYGADLDRQYYDAIATQFETSGCFGILSKDSFNSLVPGATTAEQAYKFDITNTDPQTDNPLNCTINLDGTKQLQVSVFTYNDASVIDPTFQSVLNKVNANISGADETVTASNAQFVMGTNSADTTTCRLNYFNSRNDFQYLTVVYKNFGQTSCSDASLKSFNDEIVYVLSNTVNSLVNSIINPVSFP